MAARQGLYYEPHPRPHRLFWNGVSSEPFPVSLGNPCYLEFSGQRTGVLGSLGSFHICHPPTLQTGSKKGCFCWCVSANPLNRGAVQLSGGDICNPQNTGAARGRGEVTSHTSHDSTYLCVPLETSAITLGETLETQKAPQPVHSPSPRRTVVTYQRVSWPFVESTQAPTQLLWEPIDNTEPEGP